MQLLPDADSWILMKSVWFESVGNPDEHTYFFLLLFPCSIVQAV